MSTHPCAVPGCGTPIATRLLMCAPHWHLVPKPLQQAVWRTWTHGPTAAYLEARQAAIDAAADATAPVLAEAQHRGFYAATPNGHTMHINGDRHMSDETLAALGHMMDLAVKQFDGDTKDGGA